MIISVPSAVSRTTTSSRFRGAVGADDEPSVRVLAEVFDCHGVLDGMQHVVICGAVTSGSRMDVHTPLLYYRNAAGFTSRGAGMSRPGVLSRLSRQRATT